MLKVVSCKPHFEGCKKYCGWMELWFPNGLSRYERLSLCFQNCSLPGAFGELGPRIPCCKKSLGKRFSFTTKSCRVQVSHFKKESNNHLPVHVHLLFYKEQRKHFPIHVLLLFYERTNKHLPIQFKVSHQSINKKEQKNH